MDKTREKDYIVKIDAIPSNSVDVGDPWPVLVTVNVWESYNGWNDYEADWKIVSAAWEASGTPVDPDDLHNIVLDEFGEVENAVLELAQNDSYWV